MKTQRATMTKRMSKSHDRILDSMTCTPLDVSLRNSVLRRIARSVTVASLLSIGVAVVAPATIGVLSAVAEQRGPAQRAVSGKVVDKGGGGIKAATVYLKDSRTLAVKSYVASDDGSYRFGQLAQNSDYQLWAEANGKKSGVKNISSFDTRTQFEIDLKIDK